MEGIAILLVGAALGHVLALRFGIPSTPLLMIAGVLLARTGLMPAELLESALILGATFLVFANGIELGILAYLGCGIFLSFAFMRYWWLLLAVAGALVTAARNAGAERPAAEDGSLEGAAT